MRRLCLIEHAVELHRLDTRIVAQLFDYLVELPRGRDVEHHALDADGLEGKGADFV